MSQEEHGGIHKGELLFGVVLALVLVGTLLFSFKTDAGVTALKKQVAQEDNPITAGKTTNSVQSLLCVMYEPEASVSAYLEKKKAHASIVYKGARSFLVLGEDGCVLGWSDRETKGIKLCGAGQFLPLLRETLLDKSSKMILSSLPVPFASQSASILPNGLLGLPYSCKETNTHIPAPPAPTSIRFD